MSGHSIQFLGLSESEATYEKAKVVFLPVPLEKTTSYAKGTANGPEAILQASTQVEFYDEEIDDEPFLLGLHTKASLQFEDLTLEESVALIEKEVEAIVKDKKLPFVFGGEHTISAPVVRAVGKFHPDLTVVQIDAHADLRQEYEGTPLSHASVMARILEKFPAVQIGIRALSKEEALWIKKDKLPVFFAHHIHRNPEWIDQALAAIKTEKVYLTIDIDGLDPSLVPDTGTPEPGGLSWLHTSSFLRRLMQEKEVVGMDLVELMPKEGSHGSNFIAARLASKCIGYWKKGKHF
ncbi:MAG: agmatinase [Deltaproteobacteria bacterium CG_4_10_14_0_2_um_filter_43_8]|nr:MAG: agmatinase [Deltaproteobacteria bacterium CG11_big_fil_rev_8_21_14_0_20_42_23]PJA21869.1 MAG: agmatinase [Deltaproteobacteria bacterium CG_4_10_14_0_2_um_filter_43_8]PJC64367.1 MAG: agmatinase [Deltaproteobacteria bacterium CG_4_9_14_0_2_um_filter_42_21]